MTRGEFFELPDPPQQSLPTTPGSHLAVDTIDPGRGNSSIQNAIEAVRQQSAGQEKTDLAPVFAAAEKQHPSLPTTEPIRLAEGGIAKAISRLRRR